MNISVIGFYSYRAFFAYFRHNYTIRKYAIRAVGLSASSEGAGRYEGDTRACSPGKIFDFLLSEIRFLAF